MLNISRPARSTISVIIIVPCGQINDLRSSFRHAVTAAIEAYKKTGRMVDAALAYAAHGVPVFPVSIRDKKPVAARLKDETGKPIAGTGGFWRATTDEKQIRKWWGERRRHLIGVPMGRRTGVWALDVDTDEDHADDGIAAWRVLEAEHGAIKTRQHKTSSNGVHEIFLWSEANPIGCSRGSLPNGIEVKAHGGYIVAPPSERKGRPYIVTIDIKPQAAPNWLYDLIRRRPGQSDKQGDDPSRPRTIWHDVNKPALGNRSPIGNIDELAEAIEFIPNDDLAWEDWTSYGLALYAATGGSEAGFTLFDVWSRKSAKYHAGRTLERWRGICASPPDRTGANKIFAAAIAHGWKTAPTHPPAKFDANEAARAAIRRIANKFLNRNQFQEFGDETCGADCWAVKIDTGLGKTTISIEEIARSGKRVNYAVPTHRLASAIERQFLDHGVEARVFRGRDAGDPLNPGKPMCLDLEKVELAINARQDIAATCCKQTRDDVCRFFDQCGYQRQKEKKIKVWIFASDMIFHRQPAH